ncbi:MAG: hypothetical protein EA397_05985 [Deltaproteobacteria bacterium]|nr:MAG: hypothetical protein EA397_05985 [Deltaproteobacteria bacterium]
MRVVVITAAALLPSLAWASEVVWVDPPKPGEVSEVASMARASGEPRSVLDLRSARAGFSERDRAAWRRLDRTLEELRAFETQLDGELIIARDLAAPIAAISLVRSSGERAQLRRALAYQGFAVHRLSGGDLSDPDAAPYAVELGDGAFLKPWADAAALDPDYTISAYDIAEAPERVAYAAHAQALKRVLPATLRVEDLPDGASLSLNGEPAKFSDSGLIRVLPGRHFLHLTVEGRIVERWVVEPEAGASLTVRAEHSEQVWTKTLRGLSEGPTPELLREAVQAMGGEVWVAHREGGQLKVFKLGPDGVSEATLDPKGAEVDRGARAEGLFLRGAVGVGWMWSGDFLASHPGAPATYGTVNAVMPELSAEISYRQGWLAFDAGASLWTPLGRHHTARTGTMELRPRPMPFVAVGLPWVQAFGGYLFPHHPMAGLRAELPLGELPLALRAEARIGPALSWTPDFRSHAVRSAGISIVGRTRLR